MRLKLLALFFLLVALTAHGARAGVSVNELMADPNSDWDGDGVYDFRDDEWVEIFNEGPGEADLTGFLLGDSSGLFTYGFSGLLAEGEALVVYGSQSEIWETDNGFSSVGFNMANTGDTVVLYQVVGPDTLIVDSHTFLDHEADDDRSTGRNPDGSGAWEIFDALNPYNGGNLPAGNGLPPTPGLPNLTEPVSARSMTWGAIKSVYDGR